MARFKSNSLYLKDNQKIVFGNSDDSSLYFDGIGLRLDTVISGVDPTQAYHLATKNYVDTQLSTQDDHNELNNIQGGDTNDYYHLTSVQHTDLTDGGDATIHHHDGRYYTETELDAGQLDNQYYTETELDTGQLDNRYYTETELNAGQLDNRYYTETEVDAAFVTFSGTIDHNTIVNTHNLTTDIDHDALNNFDPNEHFTEASIDHGNITGLGDDDHPQYINDTEMTTISGDIVSQMVTDHGALTGLVDDDHVQYSLVNGLRAFTATVSGVTPTLDAHLATKGYVDSVSVDKVQSGRIGLSINDTERAVSFATFGDTNYVISVILSTTDDPASIYSMTITNKTSAGFTAVFSGDIIASGYTLEWLVRHD